MVNFKETIADKLGDHNIPDESEVTFRYEETASVQHHYDDYVNDAIESSGIIYTLTDAIVDGPFYENGNWILEEMRDNDLLNDYERDSSGFEEFVADTIRDNLYEYEWIERETIRHDYKRGELRMAFELTAPFAAVKNSPAVGFGLYSISINTPAGVLISMP